MTDVGPYGTTQNANAERITANAHAGSPAGNMVGDALAGQSAAMWSTAPYVPPKPTIIGCHGKEGMCQAPPMRGTDLCFFHTPKDDGEPPAAS